MRFLSCTVGSTGISGGNSLKLARQSNHVLLLAALVMGLGGRCVAATIAEVDAAMKAFVADQQIAGAQLVLGTATEILRSESYGVRNTETGAWVDGETQFCIGSCSKMFAAAVIMSLVADDSVDLEVPIDRWLPEFADLKTVDGSTSRAPTLRELLCHRGGICSQRDKLTASQVRWIRDYRLTLAESVDGISREKLRGEPGDQFRYSGAGYCVLGRVAEAATGKPFDTLLQERISRPLGLQLTTFFPEVGRANVSVGHRFEGGALQVATNTPHLGGTKYRLPLVGGSIYSTAGEAAKFAQMLLNRGTVAGNKILNPAQWREMTKTHSSREKGGYGFGLVLGKDATGDSVLLSHSGSLSGFYSQIMMNLRTRRFAVVTFTGGRKRPDLARLLGLWVHGTERIREMNSHLGPRALRERHRF